ncbi:hypothetical protein CP061683_0847B, partial [Chlamydia psittaci 06-1683]
KDLKKHLRIHILLFFMILLRKSNLLFKRYDYFSML